MAMWDLPSNWGAPEEHYERRRRSSRHTRPRTERREHEHREPTESDFAKTGSDIVKTTSDFMLAGAGIAAITGLGGTLISQLAKK